LRIKEFLRDLAKEIIQNGNLPDSWKMAIRYGLPEVMQVIKVSFQHTRGSKDADTNTGKKIIFFFQALPSTYDFDENGMG